MNDNKCKRIEKYIKDESEGEDTYTKESGLFVKANNKDVARVFSNMANDEARHHKELYKLKKELKCN